MRTEEKELPALICLPDRELGCLTDFYFVRDLGRVDVHCKSIRPDHPWLAAENRLPSLSDFCRVVTRVMERHPQAQMAIERHAVVGDVVFIEDDPIINVDCNEIQLSHVNAEIFRILVRNAGHVVPRRTLAHFATKGDREIQLNAHIGEIRKALGAQFRARIVTVRNVGYMYQKVPTGMTDLGAQPTS